MVSWINNSIHLSEIRVKVSENKKLYLFLVLVLLLAIFLRFFNLSHLLYWMFDEERDAFVVKRMLVDKHLTLIGGSVPGAFYLAPGYFYISALPYFLSSGNPLGPAALASSLGVISVFLLFIIAKELFDKKTATFATLIYTASYLVIGYNRTWWPLTFAPLVSLVTYYCLFKIVKLRNFKWFILLSLALIVGAQSDPSNFSLMMVTMVIWLSYKLPFKNKYVFLGVFFFLFSHFPLLLFDLRHNFFNSRLILNMLTFQNRNSHFNPINLVNGLLLFPRLLSRYIYVFSSHDWSLQIVPGIFYLNQKYQAISKILFIFSSAVIVWFIFRFLKSLKKNNELGIKIVGTHLILSVFGILIYNTFFPGYTHEWFLQVLFPLFAIILGFALSHIYRIKNLRLIVWLSLSIFLFFCIKTIVYAKNSFSFGNKSNAVKWSLSQIGDKPFSLDSPSTSFFYGGYRYLYYLYGHEPVKSYMDPVFADWMYPKSSLSNKHPDTVVVILNPDFYFDPKYWDTYQIYLSKTITRKKFGMIEVLIVDNSQKWVSW